MHFKHVSYVHFEKKMEKDLTLPRPMLYFACISLALLRTSKTS